MAKEESPLDIMQEILGEGDIEALKELLDETIVPLIRFRAEQEKKIANKQINKMLELEEGL